MAQLVIRFTRQQPMHIRGWNKVQDMITADFRIRQGNIWRKLLQHWKMETMHLHFHPEWQQLRWQWSCSNRETT